jgi:hypothetical protein
VASGRLRAGGALGGRRRPFFPHEVDGAEELPELPGSEVIDNMDCRAHPVVSSESIGEFLAKHPV